MIKNIRINCETENHSFTYRNPYEPSDPSNFVMSVDLIDDLIFSLEKLRGYLYQKMETRTPVYNDLKIQQKDGKTSIYEKTDNS